jgi:hypothetical protein
MEHGDVEQVGRDIESLLNENKVDDKERVT